VFSLNNTIDSNVIYNIRFGIVISTASGNVISNNLISNINEDDAILIYRSTGNHIANNSISGVIRGITLSNYSSQNTVEGNTVSEASKMALSIHFSSDKNLIRKNQAEKSQIGIIIRKSLNNQIYDNNFIDNNQHASDDGNNTWSHEGNGNYWSGWYSTKPYTISSTATDEFPQTSELLINAAITSEPDTASFRETPMEQVVEEELVYANQNISLDKTLIIENGGKLLINNAFVESVGHFREPIKIRIESGGALEILNSTITAEKSGRAPIWIDPVEGALITITNSHLLHVDAGLSDGGPTGPAILLPSNAIIEDNIIEDADIGISLLPNAKNARIINNTFRSILRRSILLLPYQDKHIEIKGNKVEGEPLSEINYNTNGNSGKGCFIESLRY
jgi:parallel beta-helix repeat protein